MDTKRNIHGFHTTSEGRKFLRSVYRLYLAKVDHEKEEAKRLGNSIPKRGRTKIADIVSGDGFALQKKLNKRVEQALRRWAEENKSELWLDENRTMAVLERLEENLMRENDLAQICDDHASTIKKLDFVNAISNFFYPMRREPPFELINKLKAKVGLFEIYQISTNSGEVGLSGSIIHSEPRLFCKFNYSDLSTALTFHEFALGERAKNAEFIQRRKSGFVFLGAGDTLVRFIVDHENPSVRWIETLRPIDIYSRRYFDDRLPTDNPYHKDFTYVEPFGRISSIQLPRFRSYNDDQYNKSRIIVLRGLASDTAKFIERGFSGSNWDIQL